ncbi:hypothetical protein WDU94_001599 [Cyamophila willieti]
MNHPFEPILTFICVDYSGQASVWEGLELKPEQEKWVKDTTETVYSLIKQTPPDGDKFCQVVKLILKGEEHWNQWKNEGCPELKRPLLSADAEGKDEASAAKKKKKANKLPGEMLQEAYSQGKVLMGNPELTKLWNSKDNLEACKSAERDFTPSLESYFEEAIQQMDPAAMVEEQYKKVNDGNYAWRALRLLSRKCPHFFLNSTPNVEKNSEFIENMVKKCIKEKPLSQNNGNGAADPDPTEVEVDTKGEEIQEEEKEEEWEENKPETEAKDPVVQTKNEKCSDELLDKIAPLIVQDWKKLGLKFGYTADQLEVITTSKGLNSETEQARYLLKIWFEDDDDATPENLAYTLEGLGFLEAAKLLQPADSQES